MLVFNVIQLYKRKDANSNYDQFIDFIKLAESGSIAVLLAKISMHTSLPPMRDFC